MSEIPIGFQDRLDLLGQIARIDQAPEQAPKTAAEQHKLNAEERKPGCDRRLAP